MRTTPLPLEFERKIRSIIRDRDLRGTSISDAAIEIASIAIAGGAFQNGPAKLRCITEAALDLEQPDLPDADDRWVALRRIVDGPGGVGRLRPPSLP